MPTPLPPQALATAGQTLGLAMQSDPFYCYLLEEETRRGRWMGGFMTGLLRMLAHQGHIYGVGEGQVQGVVGLMPPGTHPLPVRRTLPFALKAVACRPSRRPGLRSLTRGARMMAKIDAAHPKEPCWWLCIAGVHPEAQGLGLGRELMKITIGLAEASDTCVYLETTKRANVGYYERFGFSLREEIELGEGAPPVWTMVRPASP